VSTTIAAAAAARPAYVGGPIDSHLEKITGISHGGESRSPLSAKLFRESFAKRSSFRNPPSLPSSLARSVTAVTATRFAPSRRLEGWSEGLEGNQMKTKIAEPTSQPTERKKKVTRPTLAFFAAICGRFSRESRSLPRRFLAYFHPCISLPPRGRPRRRSMFPSSSRCLSMRELAGD